MTKSKSLAVLALALVITLYASVTLANPTGGTVTYGNATITQPNASTVQVNINGNRAIINWNSFSIANGETTNFNFLNTGGGTFHNTVLSRVTGGSPSIIAGQLNAINGSLFLVNPNGIVFKGTARVNAPGLFASTLNITDEQFKAFSPTNATSDHWQMQFSAVPGTAGTIELVNGAKILTGGQDNIIVMMARSINVAQGVTLSAPNGSVMLMATKEATMSQSGYGDYGMFNMAYKTETGNNVKNSGFITVLDGTNGLTGQGGGTVAMIGNNVTQNGTIYSSTSSDKVSRILLVATNDVNVTSGSVSSVDSSGTNRAGYVGLVAGGTVTVENGANISANGFANSGGDVVIKGNGLNIGQTAVINVSASNAANSGTVSASVNGGGDVYATVEYARLAVRPNGDKMVMLNDGTLNLPPILPAATIHQAEGRLTSSMKPASPAPVNDVKPISSQTETKPVVTSPAPQDKPASSDSKSLSAPVAPSDSKSGKTTSSTQDNDNPDK